MNFKHQSIKNYYDPDSPIFISNIYYSKRKPSKIIKVISWNIKFGKHIDRAIKTLSQKPLSSFDILFLQEMSEEGVLLISKHFNLNFVYIPSNLHSKHGKNFGNAILSPHQLTNPKKIILPHKNIFNLEMRCLALCVTKIDNKQILLSSNHIELFSINLSHKYNQINHALYNLNHVKYPYVLAGGDFNTITKKGINTFKTLVKLNHLNHYSSTLNHTFSFLGIHRTLDHIIGKGFIVHSTGVYKNVYKASDHYPVWVILS